MLNTSSTNISVIFNILDDSKILVDLTGGWEFLTK